MSKIPKLPDVIRRYIDAYNNANVRVMLDCLTDDVVFQNISKGKVSLNIKSKRKFESFAKMGVEAFTSRQQTVVEAVTRGDGEPVRYLSFPVFQRLLLRAKNLQRSLMKAD